MSSARTAALLVALSMLAACRQDTAQPIPVEDAGQPLSAEVVLVGCTFLTPTHCELTAEKPLTLWVAAAKDVAIELRYDDQPLPAESQALAGGRRLTFAVPASGKAEAPLQLSFTQGDRSGRWSHALRHVSPPEAWRRAQEQRGAGDLSGARKALDALPQDDTWQSRADSLRARIMLMGGDKEAAAKALGAAIARHRRAGRLSDEARDALALCFVLKGMARLSEATAVLTASERALQTWGEAHAHAPYYRGLLAAAGGDLATAMRMLRRAAVRAEQLGLSAVRDDARLVLAKHLQRLGRYGAATVQLDGLLDGAGDSGCRRAMILNHLAWSSLLRAEHRNHEPLAPAATRQLDEALAIFNSSCPKASSRRKTRLNRALAAWHQGDTQLARTLLDRVEDAPRLSDEEAIWSVDLRGRLALAQHQPRLALKRLAKAEAIARRSLDNDGLWRALAGRAAAFEALRQTDEAITALQQAEDVLDAASMAVPMGQGRATFLGGRDASAIALTALLLQTGNQREALNVVRRARARALASAQRLGRIAQLSPAARARFDKSMERYQRARSALAEALERRWELTAAELPAHDRAIDTLRERSRQAVTTAYRNLDEPRWSGGHPRSPGELMLAFFPQPDGPRKWWCFAQDDEGLTVLSLELPTAADPEVLSRKLLDPLAAQLDRARYIRVLAYGSWQAVDVHALPYQGRPLLASRPLRYGIDLPGAAPNRNTRGALIVADAAGDLPHARSEGVVVQRALSSDWSVHPLIGTAATREAMTQRMPAARLLHFAGHGVLREDRLASELQLAGEDALTVGDILALPNVPPLVVLSGCGTAMTSPEAPLADMSLAAAFLLAGAEAVIGTARPVRDHAGAELASRIYAKAKQTGWQPGQALRQAQLSLARKPSADDWAAYRLITR